jgi:DNA-dependent RNA polymerase auxiliary subunit epsilon
VVITFATNNHEQLSSSKSFDYLAGHHTLYSVCRDSNSRHKRMQLSAIRRSFGILLQHEQSLRTTMTSLNLAAWIAYAEDALARKDEAQVKEAIRRADHNYDFIENLENEPVEYDQLAEDLSSFIRDAKED